jgi:isopentenyl-diphosphate delta-isomerase
MRPTADRQLVEHAARVVLVDLNGQPRGTAEKLAVHRSGALHLAVSVFVFTTRGELLLQRRSLTKYHSGGLWTNTACTHPGPDETPADAARRCLRDEMGMAVPLEARGAFTYRAEVPPGLIEHELDHVFVGITETTPTPNAREIAAWRFVALPSLRRDLVRHPLRYTSWLPLALEHLERSHSIPGRS